MTEFDRPAHDRAIANQFTRQAPGFAASPTLHAEEILDLIGDAAAPGPNDSAIDLACGPGTVACALARRAARVVGLDAVPAMIEEGRKLAASRGLANIEWVEGSIYAVPRRAGAFQAVTCRFAFHHLEDPARAFAEMVRVAAPGARIVLCDGLASDDAAKAEAFNAMERRRDPSTVAFRTLDELCLLFTEADLGMPRTRLFRVPYLAADLVGRSFPADGDRAGLLALIEGSIAGDTLDMGAERTPEGVRIAYRAAVLSAQKAA